MITPSRHLSHQRDADTWAVPARRSCFDIMGGPDTGIIVPAMGGPDLVLCMDEKSQIQALDRTQLLSDTFDGERRPFERHGA
jgi:hypothetical protein